MPVAFHSDATGIFFKPSGISGSISFILIIWNRFSQAPGSVSVSTGNNALKHPAYIISFRCLPPARTLVIFRCRNDRYNGSYNFRPAEVRSTGTAAC